MSLNDINKLTWIHTHPIPWNSCSIAKLPALQQINHRSQLMSPVTAPCDCPVIIPLIMTIIIIIISLLQFITPDPKEDGIMV